MSETKQKTYSDEEVEAKIAELGLDGWYLEGGWLRRKYSTDGWPTTLMLVNAIGYVDRYAVGVPVVQRGVTVLTPDRVSQAA